MDDRHRHRDEVGERLQGQQNEGVVEGDEVGEPTDDDGAGEHADVAEFRDAGDVGTCGRRIGVPGGAEQLWDTAGQAQSEQCPTRERGPQPRAECHERDADGGRGRAVAQDRHGTEPGAEAVGEQPADGHRRREGTVGQARRVGGCTGTSFRCSVLQPLAAPSHSMTMSNQGGQKPDGPLEAAARVGR
ncbi:hypothetical protein [Streptomyces monashensis]|uniref:hypothetical protein n=1 Tax=Streptomyces monashensis TaxID=1678012 RepID=UPI0015A5F1A7